MTELETFSRGWPDLWASIDGDTYIVGECGWNTENEVQQIGGTQVLSSQSINGVAKLFGKETLSVHDETGVPEPKKLEIAGNGEYVTFKSAMFSSFERLPYYDNVAVKVEWIAESMDTRKIQGATPRTYNQ